MRMMVNILVVAASLTRCCSQGISNMSLSRAGYFGRMIAPSSMMMSKVGAVIRYSSQKVRFACCM